MAEYEVDFTIDSNEISADFELEETEADALFEINAPISELSALSDVSIQNPTDGQLLKYNATTQKWGNSSTQVAWGDISGDITTQTDLQTEFNKKITKNAAITGGTFTKITYDSKGLVTSGADLGATDIPSIPLSKISDVQATATEINHLRGVTTNIQFQINSVSSNLSTERTERIAADTTLQSNITAEETARITADNTLQDNIDAEEASRIAADTTLQTNIDAEETARINAITSEATTRAQADNTLQDNIDAEEAARIAADTTLQTNINTEEAARIAADTTLQNNINTEAATREASSTTLQNKIDTEISNRIAAVTAEATARETADNTLQDNIDAEEAARISAITSEATTREAADTTLQSNITAEAATRTSADNTLQENIDAEEASRIAAITSEATAREAADTTLQNNISAEATARTNADNTLQENIDAEEASRIAAITSEATAREAADTTLQNNIDTEAATRLANDNTLQSNITAEETARINAITSEATTREAADDTLQDNIDAEETARINAVTNEATAREAADNTLQENINSEAATRASADTLLQNSINTTNSNLTAHTSDKTNPHTVTKAQVGLGNCDNTSDVNKPISTATQTALDTKVNKNSDITGGTFTKITYDSKGLVTNGENLAESDIPSLHLSKITDVTASASEVNILDGATLSTEELNILDGITASTTELNYLDGVTSAIQPQIDSKLNISNVINNVTTTTTDQALSANMGKELNDRIDDLSSLGRYLSTWSCITGLAGTNPTVSPYPYKTGDVFLISEVATSPSINYKPSGSSYVIGQASTVEETETVLVGDRYLYDGTTWTLLKVAERTVVFNSIGGSPYDNTNLGAALNSKVTVNNSITGGTNTKITYDEKGLVTSGTTLSESDIPSLHLSKISDVTATASEVNVLDGITASTTELNYTDGVTSNIQTQLDNKLPSTTKYGADLSYSNSSLQLKDQDGNNLGNAVTIESSPAIDNTTITKNASEQLQASSLVGLTATTNELNTLDGITATTTELNYTDGVTSNIQTQLDSKQVTLISGTNIKTVNNNSLLGSGNIDITVPTKISDLTDDTATNPIDKADTLTGLTATVSELNYCDGVTSNIQTQLNAKATDSAVVHLTGAETISGTKTFTQTNALAPELNINNSSGTTVASTIGFKSGSVYKGALGIDAAAKPIFIDGTNNNAVTNIVRNTRDTATGSATQPVYINASGVATAITSYSGNSATASKLGTATLGSTTQPIYLNAGTATACNTMVDLTSTQTISGAKTLSATLTFANNTWNSVGDDASIGDRNVGGHVCIKPNTATYDNSGGISFHNSSSTALVQLNASSGALTSSGSLGVSNNAVKMTYNSTTQALDFNFS